ncbi:GIY-YIG nuclease superfamily [Syncephalis fuscata]|nr:GIY-YIG nuclease superfamily [Syncephalis fuscata]
MLALIGNLNPFFYFIFQSSSVAKDLFNKLGSVHLSTNSNIPSNNGYSDNDPSNDSTLPSLNNKKVYFFDDLLINKKDIFHLVKNQGGIYIFQNKINGKRYVGSSINLANRLRSYFTDNFVFDFRSSIYSAIIKYGLINFSLIIVIIPDATKESVLALEQFAMDTYKSEYNILKIAGSTAGKEYTEDLSGEANGFYGKTHSEATRINMRKAKGTSIFIYSADKSTLLYTFDSANEAAKFIGCSRPTLLKFIRAEKFLIKGYYVTINEL